MPNLRYGVIGKGRWGCQIARILKEQGNRVRILDISRRNKNEPSSSYQNKLAEHLKKHNNDIDVLWLAIPPSDQFIFVQSAINARINTVIEKPWMCPHDATMKLINQSASLGLQIAVHYQYCYLDKLNDIKRHIDGKESIFSGCFTLSRENRLNIPALYNLGSHLVAIKCLHFPKSKIGTIKSSYDSDNSRFISLQHKQNTYKLDFLNNKEPIVQRFMNSFHDSIISDQEFPLNLKLSLKVNNELELLRGARLEK